MNVKAMPIKFIALLGVLAFGVTLAIIIGERLSTEAMAVLMGVVAGVAASIPTSLIVVWIAMQSMAKPQPAARPEPRGEPFQAEPHRIVVVQQPAPTPMPMPIYSQAGWASTAYPTAPAMHPPRRFTVIGGGAEVEDLPNLHPLEVDP